MEVLDWLVYTRDTDVRTSNVSFSRIPSIIFDTMTLTRLFKLPFMEKQNINIVGSLFTS